MIEEGYYPARAYRVTDEFGRDVYCRFGKAKTGTNQCLILFEVTDGDHAGAVLPWFGSFSGNSWERTVESLRYCGFQGDDIMAINSQRLDRPVSIKVEHHEYAGRIYARVAFVNQAGGSAKLSHTLSATEMRAFAAHLKQRLGQLGQRPPAPARQPPSEQLRDAMNAAYAAPPPEDDDLPF